MKTIEQQLKTALQQPYVNAKQFLADVIFPVFGEENYNDGGNDRILRRHPELKGKAETSGIMDIRFVGDILLEGSELNIFDITLDYKKQLQRNRVEVQQIIRRTISSHSGAFIIFHYQSGAKWEWRFTFCHKGASMDDTTDAKRYTFLLGPGQSCRTAAENFVKIHEKIEREGEFEMDDIIRAFDVEALSKEFFQKYKVHYERFCTYIYDNRWDETKFGPFFASCDDKLIRDYVKKLLGRLVFLQFLQKKGWLGIPAGKPWGEGDRDFLQHLFANASPVQQEDFLDAVLEPLFQNALDRNRASINQEFDTGVAGFRACRIPYLNGGLFGKDAEIDDANSDFPAVYFHDLFDFFYQYNFTIDENDPNDAQVGIDPEMLGRIFENLLEDNKDKGAFYTPKAIVQYMCKESLIAYLQNGCSTDRARNAARAFVETHDAEPLRELHMEIDGKKCDDSVLEFFDEMLRKVKICDPAIGSGAFPMGLLRELYACRAALEDFNATSAADIKKDIIQNSIYGVDIERGAVDIARLRFWLSLILDEEDPQALPNLDFKIMQGNSLLESYHGVDLSQVAIDKNQLKSKLKVNARTVQGSILFDDEQEAMQDIQKNIRRYFSTEDHSAKQFILAKIENATRQYLLHRASGRPDLQEEIETLPLFNDQFFLWHTFFADVFAEGGFDIVIGNPPYIQLQADGGLLGNLYKDCGFETFASMGDIYCLFYEKGCHLLKHKGHLCFITSNKWMRTAYGKKTRAFFAKNTNPKLIIDFGNLDVFENATVVTNILLLQVSKNEGKSVCCSTNNQPKETLSQLTSFVLNNSAESSFWEDEPWSILTPQELSIKRKMEKVGIPIKDSSYTINYGVKTGFNDAFIITSSKREELLSACTDEERERTNKVIKPMLRGKDIKRYVNDETDLYIIFIPWHFPLHLDGSIKGVSVRAEKLFSQNYPVLYKHFNQYKDDLSNRNKAETGVRYEWYAMQRWGANYWKDFEKEKIVWGNLNLTPTYSSASSGVVISAPSTMITPYDETVFAILNSKLGDFYIRQIGVTRNGGYFEYKPMFIEQLPIISPKLEDRQIIESLVLSILKAKQMNPNANTSDAEREIDQIIYRLYGLTEEEIEIVENTKNKFK